jgi:hypothetical protein
MAQKKISQLPTGTYFMTASWVVGVEDGVSVKYSPSQVNPFRGDWAGTNAFPTTGGRYTSGVPAQGDRWRLTAQLTIGSDIYDAGTIIEAAINTPGQTNANWIKHSVQL